MESLFKALGHKQRLWIVERLLDAPTKQTDLMSALAQSGREVENGQMSNWIKDLVGVGLVERGDKQHDPILLTNAEQVGRLLTAASALTTAATTKAQRAAGAKQAKIRRATMKAVPDQVSEG